MDKEYLIKKREELETKKLEALDETILAVKIEEKVAEYRAKLETEYREEICADIVRIDHYLDFIEEELADLDRIEKEAEEARLKEEAEAEAAETLEEADEAEETETPAYAEIPTVGTGF